MRDFRETFEKLCPVGEDASSDGPCNGLEKTSAAKLRHVLDFTGALARIRGWPAETQRE